MAANFLCGLYSLDLVDSDEFFELIALHQLAKSNIRANRRQFDLNQYSNKVCRSLFRFSRLEILKLVDLLGLNGTFVTRKRFRFTGTEGVCILLRRLSYPGRLVDLSRQFGRSPMAISSIFNWTLLRIDSNYGHILTDLDRPWLNRANLFRFGNAISTAGSPIPNIWGFIDGAARNICRPGQLQRQYYSGHKRNHCVKYQGIMCPNGIIARLDGPYIGRRHDSFVLELSKLLLDLDIPKMKLRGGNFHLFGDTGYVNTNFVLTNFRNPRSNSMEKEFNKCMAELRVVVEWGYGKVVSLFAFVDFKKNQKLLLQPIGKYYRVATILTNCHTCLYSSQVSDYFGLDPPSLEEYLST